MRHQDLIINHKLESWTFANDTARLAAGAYVAGDIGRIGYQSNTGEYWRLTGTGPAWAKTGGLIMDVGQSGVSATTRATSSITFVNAGAWTALGGTAQITPVRSSKAFVTFTGAGFTTGGLFYVQLRSFGTTAPGTFGTPAGGTVVGGMPTIGATSYVPFTVSAVITNLTQGVINYFDLAMAVSVGTVTGTINNYAFSGFELS